jgi:hypothetical protein
MNGLKYVGYVDKGQTRNFEVVSRSGWFGCTVLRWTSMLSVDKPCNITDWYLLKGIIRNSSDVHSKEGFIKNNDIRTTKSTICTSNNKRATRALDVLMDGICMCTLGNCICTSINNNRGRKRRRVPRSVVKQQFMYVTVIGRLAR